MKVGFCRDINIEDSDSGKHKFLIRLAKQMRKSGITISNKSPDVNICMPGDKMSSTARFNVLRLDGLILNNRFDYKNKNKKLFKLIQKSDAIVYQGKFCKKAYTKFLKVKKEPFTIIPNGVSTREFYIRNPKNYFLANCKWRPHKRLKDIVKSFLLALEMGLDSDLIVTGEPDYKIKHSRIKYVKWKNKKEINKLLSESIASIHLTWLDWCPNSMVEAIVSGNPIIYTASGGQTELGEGSGIAIKDTKWNFKPIDLYDPPAIDRMNVAKAMIEIKNNDIEIKSREDLYIENVCKKYISFFRELIGK